MKTTEKFRIIKDSPIYNNDKCASIGEDALLIDSVNGGIYLGNNTNQPKRVAVNNIDHLATKDELQKLITNTELKFYCIGTCNTSNK